MEFEKEIEAYLVKKVKGLGGLCWKFTSPGMAGVPDRIVLINGICIFVELKRPDGRVSMIQKVWHQKLRDLGFRVEVLKSMDEVDTFAMTLWSYL